VCEYPTESRRGQRAPGGSGAQAVSRRERRETHLSMRQQLHAPRRERERVDDH
jgi:hypothetical protein